MENRIRKHIEGIFAGAPNTAKTRDLREEMIINVIERYHDMRDEGMNEEDAYRAAITGIGDVSGLIDSLKHDAAASAPAQMPPPRQDYAYAAPQQQPERRKGLSTGAIVAIVICSTILLLSLISGIIAMRITGQLFSGDGFLSNILGIVKDETGFSFNPGGFSFDDDEGFDNTYIETGEYSVSADGISAIAVEWVAGGITICPAPEGTTDILFTEAANGTVSDAYALRYNVSGDKLTIRFCDSTFWKTIDWSDLFNSVKVPQKQLTLYIPASLLGGGLDQLTVEGVSNTLEVSSLSLADAKLSAVSGSINVVDSSFSALSLESVSGNITTSGCAGESVRADNVSGSTAIGGDFGEYNLYSVSGGIGATTAAASRQIHAETVSGDITVSVGGFGFTASVDTVSGRFSSGSLPVSIQNDKYVYGDGAVKIDLETVSGNITLE
jgi:hypothetical protein